MAEAVTLSVCIPVIIHTKIISHLKRSTCVMTLLTTMTSGCRDSISTCSSDAIDVDDKVMFAQTLKMSKELSKHS